MTTYITDPNPPTELWGIWNGRCWVLAIDCSGSPIVAYSNERDAEVGAEYHRNNYEMPDAKAVRIK